MLHYEKVDFGQVEGRTDWLFTMCHLQKKRLQENLTKICWSHFWQWIEIKRDTWFTIYCIHLVLTASRSNCYLRNPRDDFLFLVLLSTKHSNSCLWTPNDPQHGMIVRRNLTLFSQKSWFNSTSNFNIQYCQAYTQVQINQ